MTATTIRPEDFKAIDCNDGIAITKTGEDAAQGREYEVRDRGKVVATAADLWTAMRIVEILRK